MSFFILHAVNIMTPAVAKECCQDAQPCLLSLALPYAQVSKFHHCGLTISNVVISSSTSPRRLVPLLALCRAPRPARRRVYIFVCS